jgi:UDP-N-acetylglucosamine 1-carboxyvinyltransferase
MGVVVNEFDDYLEVTAGPLLKPTFVQTKPYPGFPTDMQPQMTTLLTISSGVSVMTEGVWDNRFKYVDQLTMMGAKIKVDGKVAIITGVDELTSAPVKATDLRAGAAMVLAGLAANGTTEIENVEFIDRGYDNIVEKLSAVGADIKRVEAFDPNARRSVV